MPAFYNVAGSAPAPLGVRRLAVPVVAAPTDGSGRDRTDSVGYGRVGKLVAELLTRHGGSWTAIERIPKLIETARREGHDVFFGDAARSDLLQRFGLDTALALVVTMDSPQATEDVVTTARAIRPDLNIAARAHDAQQAQRLYELGVADAVAETIEASLQLSEALLVRIGIPMESVVASIRQRRAEFRDKLNSLGSSGARSRRFRRH